ncbi:uncharacterized protein LOC123504080 [Portunus trituberculatus]|uniref:uncharacterized protein LOC123504080 n=1 Tax=Portunus trituberculatus TaxID=210409 RepID=UPI001E1CE4AB|nr:uncharacterized protein LOC123504080 [Portunus trituberculatus]
MGKTRVALFTVFTCISLTSQTFPTKNNDDTTYPEGGNDSPPSNNAGLRSVKIDVFTTYHNYVLFNMSNLDPSKHQYRIKIQPLACEHPFPFSTWKDISKSIVNMRFNVRPYTNMTLEVQDKITGKIIGRNSTITHAKEPEAMVTELECNTRYCIATIDDNCWKYNDYNMTVQFTLKPSSKELRKPLVTKRAVINSEGKAEIPLKGLDLLPFTNYTVTATLANNMGVATNSSLTNEASFTTMAENPGKVSRLAVTHSTPNSLHVEWSPPADDPPKGKLKKYELVWNIHDQTSNKENVKVMHNIENFTITGLEPNTLYDIKVCVLLH